MSEKLDPPAGLLSKMVRFVRNTTVSWTDLEALDADRQGDYSKHVLKERIERKRGNDFVRSREFDQLRKLRQRGPQTGDRVEDPAARPSFFHSSLPSSTSDDRAGTLKKIDEIEAHMSQQWWKSEDSKGSVRTEVSPLPAASQGSAPHTNQFAPTLPPPLPEVLEAFEAFEALEAQQAQGQIRVPSAATPPLQRADGDEAGAAEMRAVANAAARQEPSLDDGPLDQGPAGLPEAFVHHPDLEEAAIRFANGDYDGAETSLKHVLELRAGDTPEQLLEIWKTLFDLYRATGQLESFEVAAIKFAGRFERSAPQWFSMPMQLGIQAAPTSQSAGLAQREFAWNGPPTVTLQTMTALQAALGRAAAPWKLTWSRVSAIDAEAVPLLAAEFTRWADHAESVIFVGADALRALMEAQTQSGDREQDPSWWHLRMAALRLMGLADEFEMVALDYCVTYEVSPPSWLPALCSYEGDSGTPADAHADAHADSGWHGSAGWAQSTILSGPHSMPFSDIVVDGLLGVIEGDATDALNEVVAQMPSVGILRVPCQRLIRIDFSAAGSVLNWAAEQQGRGRVVEFVQLHRLAAVFFNVVGVGEYGSVVVRKD